MLTQQVCVCVFNFEKLPNCLPRFPLHRWHLSSRSPYPRQDLERSLHCRQPSRAWCGLAVILAPSLPCLPSHRSTFEGRWEPLREGLLGRRASCPDFRRTRPSGDACSYTAGCGIHLGEVSTRERGQDVSARGPQLPWDRVTPYIEPHVPGPQQNRVTIPGQSSSVMHKGL